MKRFPQILKEERKKQNLTQERLAKLIGSSQAQISMYEHGIEEPTLFNAVCLADALNVSLDYLAGKEEVKNEKAKNRNISR